MGNMPRPHGQRFISGIFISVNDLFFGPDQIGFVAFFMGWPHVSVGIYPEPGKSSAIHRFATTVHTEMLITGTVPDMTCHNTI